MSQCIPWDELAEAYYEGLSVTQGRPTKDARLVIGAVIIKHKLCLADRETVAQIQEHPYLHYFVGLAGYQMEAPFVPSQLIEIRKRMGPAVFDVIHDAVIEAVENAKKPPAAKRQPAVGEMPGEDDEEPPGAAGAGSGQEKSESQGKLILDATVAPQAICFPTDLILLN